MRHSDTTTLSLHSSSSQVATGAGTGAAAPEAEAETAGLVLPMRNALVAKSAGMAVVNPTPEVRACLRIVPICSNPVPSHSGTVILATVGL